MALSLRVSAVHRIPHASERRKGERMPRGGAATQSRTDGLFAESRTHGRSRARRQAACHAAQHLRRTVRQADRQVVSIAKLQRHARRWGKVMSAEDGYKRQRARDRANRAFARVRFDAPRRGAKAANSRCGRSQRPMQRSSAAARQRKELARYLVCILALSLATSASFAAKSGFPVFSGALWYSAMMYRP